MTASSLHDDGVMRWVSRARSHGWREAVQGGCAASPQLLRYATDVREGDALHLVPAVTPRRALFLGNALAIVPFILAERFEIVVAADWYPSRLALARQRAQEDGVDNLLCAPAGAGDDVSSRIGPFDLVVLGEECPEATSSLPFDEPWTPARLSGLVGRGGCLMYGARFRLVDPLARCLARPWVRRPPASYPAHARLLTAAGLTPVATYWRRPDTRPYHAYVPLAPAAVVDYWLEHAPRARGIRARAAVVMAVVARRAGLLHHIVDNFLMIAQRR